MTEIWFEPPDVKTVCAGVKVHDGAANRTEQGRKGISPSTALFEDDRKPRERGIKPLYVVPGEGSQIQHGRHSRSSSKTKDRKANHVFSSKEGERPYQSIPCLLEQPLRGS